MRLQEEDDVARLEDRQPRASGAGGHPGVIREVRHVQELAHAAGGEPHEASERGEVLHRADPAHVALHVGRDVVAQCLRGVTPLGMDARVAAAEQDFVDIAGRAGQRTLRQCERQQAQHSGTARERLADRVGPTELLAAGEDEPGPPGLAVDEDLEV